MTRAPLPTMILVQGRATSMGGGDKPLVLLAGRPLPAHLLNRQQPQVGRLAPNTNGDAGRRAGWGLPVVGDRLPDHPGPLAAMDRAAAEGATHVLTMAGDSPFPPADLALAEARLAAL